MVKLFVKEHTSDSSQSTDLIVSFFITDILVIAGCETYHYILLLFAQSFNSMWTGQPFSKIVCYIFVLNMWWNFVILEVLFQCYIRILDWQFLWLFIIGKFYMPIHKLYLVSFMDDMPKLIFGCRHRESSWWTARQLSISCLGLWRDPLFW